MNFRNWGILFLTISISILWAQNPLKIYCIDVDQASSTLIVSPSNKYILIDASWTGDGYDIVYPFLQNLGIKHLDYTIATHYHDDHIGGMDEVIYSLSGGIGHNESILGYCYDRGDSSSPLNTIYTGYVNAVGSKRRVIGLNETLNLGGGAYIICLVRNGKVANGDSVNPASGENYRSIGFVLKHGQFEMCISGDLTGISVSGDPDVETKVSKIVRNVDIYLANHHGGPNSSNNTFLDSLRPEVTIISQGTVPQNTGHPYQECINRLVAHNSYIYQMNDNPLGGTFSIPGSGKILNTTAAITVNNSEYIVNGDTYPIDGVRRDGTVLEIISPKDTISEGTLITPKALVKNLGNITESFPLRFKIGGIYNKTKTISDLFANETDTVTFDTFRLSSRENYTVSCSTEVPNDTDRDNDKKTLNITVAFFDAELKEIVSPASNDTISVNDSIAPKVIIKDNSVFGNPSLVKVYCRVRASTTIYSDSVQQNLNPGDADTIVFSRKSLTGVSEGTYQCSTWVVRNSDLIPNNDFKSQQFYIGNITSSNAWAKLRNMSGIKQVKAGGALVAGHQDKIYAFKGNNTREFYVYDINSNGWSSLESIPYHPQYRKRVGKGAALVYNKFSNPDIIYALKGNNTLELWEYNVETNTWSYKTTVPIGLANRKVKGGAGMAFVKQGNQTYIYLLKGNNTTEFFGYHIQSDTWMKNLHQALSGPDAKSFKDGSCITTGPGNRLYVLKGGAKYNEFYVYDISADTWGILESIPRYNPISRKKTKIKDGAALCYNDDDNVMYAFKGGNNQDFWMYDIEQNSWTVLDTLPRTTNRKKIGSGGALAYANNKVYALKGNKTNELWSYDPLFSQVSLIQNQTPVGIITEQSNKTHTKVTRNHQLFESTDIRIFNIFGQLIKTSTSHKLSNLQSNLKPGIYLIQNKSSLSDRQFTTKKVIIY